MTGIQALIGHAGTTLVGAGLLGLMVRRRYALWYSFAVYLAVILASSLLTAIWPARFYHADFYQATETALALLRLGMALELAFRVFRSFPGALATLRGVLLIVLGVTLLAVLAAPTGPTNLGTFVGQLLPRVLNGTVWLFSAIAALILWYRLPVPAFYKAVLLSYVPYLLIFSVAANALGNLGWERGVWVQYANQVAFLALLAYWSYAVWRPEPQPVRAARIEEADALS